MSEKINVGDIVALKSDDSARLAVLEIGVGEDPECKVFSNGKLENYFLSQLSRISEETGVKATDIADLKAKLTAFHICSPSTSKLFSYKMGDINFVPYQYRPVLKLIKSDRPRLLIADEVGVGKTIETGLLINELSARMDLKRVMIVCPKPLISENKWYSEMKRFGQSFTALDGKLLRYCISETDLDREWPEQYGRCIVPFSLFDSDLILGKKGKSGRVDIGLDELKPPPKFDLIIVDEAHHARNPETYLNNGLRLLTDNAHAVVFLSATPVQLGNEDLFNLLNLIRPDLVMDLPSFRKMAEPNSYLNAASIACRGKDPDWPRLVKENLISASFTDWGKDFIKDDPKFLKLIKLFAGDVISDEDRISAIRTIDELLTFSGLINRTRRRDIGDFTVRKPNTVRVKFTTEQEILHNSLLDIIAKIFTRFHGSQNIKFMMGTIRRQAASCLYGLRPLLENMLAGKIEDLEIFESENEFDGDLGFISQVKQEVGQILDLAKNLDPYDPKIESFVSVVTEKTLSAGNNKCLVFSTFRHTLAYISSHLEKQGLRFGVVHGGVSEDDRRVLRSRFKFPKESPDALDVLISSEVGCEGLDFQFCDMLINYDLPWNPMRIEQRIGRIDRHGQESEAVAIVNMITEETIDADIYDRCLWRIGVFQQALGGSEEILGQISKELHELSESFELSPDERKSKIDQLRDNVIRKVEIEKELEENDSDLFGLNVPKADWEAEISKAECTWLSPDLVELCLVKYFLSLPEFREVSFAKTKVKTLSLNHNQKKKLAEETSGFRSSAETSFRSWFKWLDGLEQKLKFSFQQDVARDEGITHMNILHPLIKKAAGFLNREECLNINLEIKSPTAFTGIAPFALYSWHYKSEKDETQIVSISPVKELETFLPELFLDNCALNEELNLSEHDKKALQEEHYKRWSCEKENHLSSHKQIINKKVSSLTSSFLARKAMIEERLHKSVDEKIIRMKKGELVRVQTDYENRRIELEAMLEKADIRATKLFEGMLKLL